MQCHNFPWFYFIHHTLGTSCLFSLHLVQAIYMCCHSLFLYFCGFITMASINLSINSAIVVNLWLFLLLCANINSITICSNIVTLIIIKDLVAYYKTVISLLSCTCKSTCMAFSPVKGKMLLFGSSMLMCLQLQLMKWS